MPQCNRNWHDMSNLMLPLKATKLSADPKSTEFNLLIALAHHTINLGRAAWFWSSLGTKMVLQQSSKYHLQVIYFQHFFALFFNALGKQACFGEITLNPSLNRVRNCDSLVANATKHWALATKFWEVVASWWLAFCPITKENHDTTFVFKSL